MALATGLYAFAASISVISNTYSESLQLFLTTNSDHFGLIKQLPSFITCGLICIILTELVKAAALYLGSPETNLLLNRTWISLSPGLRLQSSTSLPQALLRTTRIAGLKGPEEQPWNKRRITREEDINYTPHSEAEPNAPVEPRPAFFTWLQKHTLP